MRVLSFGTLLLATSCSTTKQSVGIENVDSLVSRVERVHLEVELSKQAVYDAVAKLGVLMAKDFTGDPAEAFATFAIATEESEKQANELRSHVAPMRSSAERVFAKWTKSLDDFNSPRIRERSAARLDATRERFTEVHETAVESQAAFDVVNAGLRDLVLFLGHDFNTASVQEIHSDAIAVRDEARGLSKTFDSCMEAAATYVSHSALRGEVRVETETVERPASK